MRRVSTKAAARRLGRFVLEAKEAPVMIERYGRPCAVIVSVADFEVLQRVLDRRAVGASAALLEGAIEKIAEGRFNKAVNLRNAALLLAGITR